MATYLYRCRVCPETIREIQMPRMEPPAAAFCDQCFSPMQRLYTAPTISVHQTGSEWLNEVAAGRGDPPSGLTREQGKAAALAKAKSDRGMANQSSKQPKTISTGSKTAMRPYVPE